MQTLDDEKRRRILKAAAELFASRPFHKVLLADVATSASVGKGTLYQYFNNKEDLFVSVLLSGISDLTQRMRDEISTKPSDSLCQIRGIIHIFFNHWVQNPHVFDLMRQVSFQMIDRPEWQEQRMEITGIITHVIEDGVENGVFFDSNPSLTAQFIPGIVRSLMLKNQGKFTLEEMEQHVADFVLRSLTAIGVNVK